MSLFLQHINGLPKDWQEKMDKVHQLFSRIPHYNKVKICVVLTSFLDDFFDSNIMFTDYETV